NSSWLVGEHWAKIYAQDIWNNTNDSLQYLTFDVTSKAKVEWVSPTGQVNRSNSIVLTCRVYDIYNNQGLEGFYITFKDSNEETIDWDTSDTNGYASITWDASSYDVGPEDITCTATNTIPYYSFAAGDNSDSETLTLIGTLSTQILSPSQGSEFHKGQTISLNSTTSDENGQQVSVNAVWRNETSQIASGENATWLIPSNQDTGSETITVNTNATYYNPDSASVVVYIWGYSEVSESFIQPDQINQSQTVTMGCLVRDANSTQGIQGYNVSFWRNGTYINSNLTNSSGWGVLSWQEPNSGNWTIVCNISDSASLYYNATPLNSQNQSLTVYEDSEPPQWDQQGQSTSTPEVGDTVTLYARWWDNADLNTAWLETNESGTWENKSAYDSPMYLSGTGPVWTNFNWQNSSVHAGTTVAWRIWCNDSNGNLNVTDTMYFTTQIIQTQLSAGETKDPVSVNQNTTLWCDYEKTNGENVLDANITFEIAGENHTAMRFNSTAGTGRYEYDYQPTSPGTITWKCYANKTDHEPQTSGAQSLTVLAPPNITNINITPVILGYGFNVTISANVSDDEEGVDTVLANITYPDGSYQVLEMLNESDDYIYKTNFTDTWSAGVYNVTIWANDTGGTWGEKTTDDNETYRLNFTITVDASMMVSTLNDTYGPNEDVNLTPAITNWWDPEYTLRKRLNITNNNATEILVKGYSINITLDTQNLVSQNKLLSSGNDLRIVWFNSSSNQFIELNRVNETNFNTPSTEIWFPLAENISAGGYDNNYWLYYDNPSTNEPPANRSEVYLFWDDFDTLDTNIWSTYGSPSVSNSILSLNTGDGVATQTSYPKTIMRARVKWNPDSSYVWWGWISSASSGSAPFILFDSGGAARICMTTDWNYCPVSVVPSDEYHIYELKWTEDYIEWEYDWETQHTDETGNGDSYDLPYVLRNSNSANTVYVDWIIGRRYLKEEPTVGIEEEERLGSVLLNKGETNTKGCLLMRIQKYQDGGWVNFGLPVVNDAGEGKTRTLNASYYLELAPIWNGPGEGSGWNTDMNEPGLYRVFSVFTDPSGNILKDESNQNIQSSYEFQIISPSIEITNLTHENHEEHAINEYEVGDDLAWINITIQAHNTTSINTNITLNILDYNSQPVSWGPDERKECGDIPAEGTCERRWDNSSQGYPIPLDASPGSYNFTWNITVEAENIETITNTTFTFTLHDVRHYFSSSLDPIRVIVGNNATYNFTLYNPWSKNLTGINITIACPSYANISCSCILDGQSGYTCQLDALEPGEKWNASFLVVTNSSSQAGDYPLNVTVNYTNPGLEAHSWEEQETQTLEVRLGYLEITAVNFPVNVTRGTLENLTAYVNNTNQSSQTNVWLNYTLPSGWNNYSGLLQNFTPALGAGEIFWNNITANITLEANPGFQEIRLDSSSDEGAADWITPDVWVWARTYINPVLVTDYTPTQGQTITITCKLTYDNGTVIPGENITFRDENYTDNPGDNFWEWNSSDWEQGIFDNTTNNLTGNITLNYTGPGDTNWALQDNAGNTSAQYAPEDINDGVTTQCGGGWGDCFGGCSPYPCIAVNITLEKPWVINKIRTFWWDPDNDEEYDRHYNYYINVSLDGTNWTMIVDRRDNDTTWDGGYPDAVYEEVDEFQPILAKYVMIVGTYNSANSGIHLIEAEVYSVAYEQQGTYISDWIDTGKNLTKFALNAQTQNTENGNITYWFRS
ncbi:MAG: hypothetical protein DRP13_03875, partial [Candidatus Aenigmatarchaeota archaeon]